MSEIQLVDTNLIVPGQNDRTVFDPVALQQLADSIKANGLAQPITVRPIEGGLFQIVAGERRYRACRLLGWAEVPCIVRNLTAEEAAAIMLVENTSRQNLNPIDEARAYQARIDLYNWSVERIAEVAGVSVPLVQRRISLLKLVPEAQHLIAAGGLPVGHAEYMAKLDANRQRIALRVLSQSDNVPLRMFRQLVDQLYEQQCQETLWDVENFWTKQIEAEAAAPTRGKAAVTGAPVRNDLPPVEIRGSTETTAAVIDRYIAQLLETGHTAEAATLGTVYDALVRGNFLSVPNQSLLRAH